jgi:CRISPR/Cas system CSM-associated protein Csm4 (group 5 of RAMP superfamily)
MAGNEKHIKKIQYISEKLFKKVMVGNPLADILNDAVILSDGQTAISKEEINRLPPSIRTQKMPIWKTELTPHVTIERSTQKSSIFFTGKVTYAKDCGLWFGIRWFKQDTHQKRSFQIYFRISLMPGWEQSAVPALVNARSNLVE